MSRIVLASLLLAACGDDGGTNRPVDSSVPADADTRDLLVRLNALPGVTAVEEACIDPGSDRCFGLAIEQPVDHGDPTGPTFAEHATLIHRGFDRPMVAVTTGYWNFYGYYRYELTYVLDGNQLVLEHRYFAESTPSPADYSQLTIANAAADEHHVIEVLKRIYDKPWITTGASKGGMTATYHLRNYPDDVAGSVPYVAPLSRQENDPRYLAFLDTVGPPACRQALRNLQVEMLKQARFDQIVTRAEAQGFPYTRVAIRPAAESAIVDLEWSFWQYQNPTRCASVPATSATDDQLFAFLDSVSPVSSIADGDLAQFDSYYYQAYAELGFPDNKGAHVKNLLRYTDADYTGILPIGAAMPTYRPEAMADIDGWVKTSGAHLIFIYGGWDPWSGGKYDLGGATDSMLAFVPEGNHGSGVLDLEPADQAAAFAKLEAWSGVVPNGRAPRSKISMPKVPIPSAVGRAIDSLKTSGKNPGGLRF